MRPRRLTVLTAILILGASCSSRDAASDKSRPGAGSQDSARPGAVTWFEGTAPLLLTPAHSNDRALVVAADSLAPDLEDGTLTEPGTLVRLDGTFTTVRVSISSGTEGCVDAAVQPAPSSAWGVGFVGAAPTAIRVDSLRAISTQDSSALAPTIFRLASGIPNAPGGRFAGLPFSLVDLWRMRLADGTLVLVATTKRQLNQEDSPLEERTMLVAESDSAGGYSLVYSSRSTGAEETVEGSELLAAVSFSAPVATELVFSHDFGDEVGFGIVERLGRGNWRLRWSSRRFSC